MITRIFIELTFRKRSFPLIRTLWKDNDDEKLFFVVETKGSTGLFDLRPKERSKIDCGKKHFKAIGSEMIVASGIEDVEEFALNSK